ncbi:MAG TPA: hypothetical protein VLK33_17520 [Terriglobales bacterium]|nr:hypothetical protein [Terriglobales bacterium]
MALTPFKWVLEVGLADNSGDIAPRFYEAPYDAFADFDTFILAKNALLTALGNMTDAVVASHRMSLVTINDALALPASGVENENQAFLSGKIDGDPTQSATQSIPAAKPGIFVSTVGPGANVVDMNDGAVTTWVGFFDQTSTTWTISDGQAWTGATVKGKRRHVKRSGG